MTLDAAERRVLEVWIWGLNLPCVFALLLAMIPADLAYNLLHPDRGWALARAIAPITQAVVFVSPFLFGFSAIALRKVWAVSSRSSRLLLSALVTSSGAWVLYFLYLIIILTTGNFR